ncbi:putative deoxyribonuclease TATDN1-like protein [Lichtheimia hyalospora FSU 10163]|nr:putative deoxyribonuclease TATDN1-like protein [Lichtheimia hyalospora FSU 10163]
MRFIDIGANLTDPMFRGVYRGKQAHEDDWHLVLDRARKAGVEKLIITGTNLEEAIEAIDVIKQHNENQMLYSTVGCHPTRCDEFEQSSGGPTEYLNHLLKLVQENASTVVAIGECGLDYDRLQFCSKETQKKYFEAQFELAEKTKLPMFLHNRNTGDDFVNMIKANRHRFTNGVVHSFTSTVEEMKQLVDLGLYIGINGCSLKTEENLQVVKEIPRDRLMIETDAPWCEIRPTHASSKHLSKIPKEELELYAPLSKKKERFEKGLMVKNRCEPCATGLVLHVIAAIRDEDPEELAEIIWNNTCNVFFPNTV